MQVSTAVCRQHLKLRSARRVLFIHFLLILFGLKGDVRTVLASRCPLPIHRKVANGTKVAKGTNGETFAPFESFASFRSFMHTGSGIYIHRYEHRTHSTIKIFLLLVFSFQLRLYFDISLKKRNMIHPQQRVFLLKGDKCCKGCKCGKGNKGNKCSKCHKWYKCNKGF